MFATAGPVYLVKKCSATILAKTFFEEASNFLTVELKIRIENNSSLNSFAYLNKRASDSTSSP